jgi:hypothetical protein
MPASDRPRTTIEALFEPLIGSDNGEQGIGPTLGEDVGAPASAPGRTAGEAPSFAARRRDLVSTTAHTPLGSEIFRASRGFRGGGLREPGLREPGLGGAGRAGGAGPTAGDVGGARAAGFGASLGQDAPTPGAPPPPAADAEGGPNDQADARLDQARAQSGAPDRAAPDQTRAAATKGSLNADDGL